MNARALALAGLGVAAWMAWRHRPGDRLDGQIALITGGSRGLGLNLARQLGALGVTLALVARDEEELRLAADELRGSGYPTSIWPYDLRDADGIKDLVRQVAAHHGRIDILVNNAGIITVGPFELFTPRDFDESLAIHVTAPQRLIAACVPLMKQQGGGRIVNISSIGGKIGVPHLSAYCAGKFALVGLSKTLRAELAPYNIAVTTVCPGLMRTGSHWNAQFKGQRENEFAWFAHGACLPGTSISATRAARQIVSALRRGDPELIITLQAQAAALADSLLHAPVASISSLIARLLPGLPAHGGKKSRPGWDATSQWVPSPLTRLGDHAAVANNELRGHAPPAV